MAGKKHQKGAQVGSTGQGAGRHRGAETGNGYTASTGRARQGKVTVTFQGAAGQSGKQSRLRTIADVITGKHRSK